jgi:DNA-binding NarL/FixJ family response regulator
MEPRTAVLFDRHPLWLDALEEVLHGLCVEVKGKATEPAEALSFVDQYHPDVLVLEQHQVRGADGRSENIVRGALDRHEELKVVVLSASSETADIDAAFASGAAAYVFKTARPEDVASAVRQAFDASVFLAPVHAAAMQQARPGPRERDNDPGLTKRESEILRLVSEGHSNNELARMLWVTEQTVKFHLSNIYRKLDVSNRTEAGRWAQTHGLLNTVHETALAI